MRVGIGVVGAGGNHLAAFDDILNVLRDLDEIKVRDSQRPSIYANNKK